MDLPDDRLRIDTPENVVFQYRVAGIGSRFLAAVIDSLIIVLLQIVIGLALAWIIPSSLSREGDAAAVWFIALVGLFSFLVFWGYYIFFETIWNGKSPGKRVVGLTVIRADGTPITLTESLIRNLVRLVDFLPLNYGIGVVTMFIDSQSRRLGDLAAGTLVVLDQPPVTLQSLQSSETAAREPTPGTAFAWPVERLTGRDLQVIEDFLERRDQFSNRAELAAQLLRSLMERMELRLDSVPEDQAEARILEIARAARSRSV